jgi:threonine synthase
MVAVSDEDILDAMRLLGRTSGIFGEPAGVTGLAGLRYLGGNGVIKSDEKIVAIVTGNGLKDVKNAIAAAGEPIRVDPSLQCLVEELKWRGIE